MSRDLLQPLTVWKVLLIFNKDQQIGQLYELMQAIRKQDLSDEVEESDVKPDSDK